MANIDFNSDENQCLKPAQSLGEVVQVLQDLGLASFNDNSQDLTAWFHLRVSEKLIAMGVERSQ